MPYTRWLFSSYAERLSKRDSLKCRRLLQSNWYQERWGDKFYIVSDQNEKMRFENSETGCRIATSVGGFGTGEGGDKIVVDDPHNIVEAESETKRETTLMWWDESMSTRLNNERTGAKVIIMQRVHHNDLCGHVLENEGSYVHLCLPARYEGNKVKTCLPMDSEIKFKDPRKEEGEPLWPGKFDLYSLDKREDGMTQYAIAGQHQQRPSVRGGAMFRIEGFVIINALPAAQIIKSIRYWDKAGTQDGGKRTAGVLMHKLNDGRQVVEDVRKGQWEAGRRERLIRQTADVDGKSVEIWIEQEPGSGGKESAEATIRNLAGFKVKAEKVTGNKETRAEPYADQIEAQNVLLMRDHWTKEFIDEHEIAPKGKYSDQWDASAGAFNKLNDSSAVTPFISRVGRQDSYHKMHKKPGEDLVAVYEGDEIIGYERIGTRKKRGIFIR